ncbi:MAG: nickel pincer cofactor biosynthesis protein LarC [Gemmatimonadaceae bacterium]
MTFRAAILDPFSGIAGDMTLGALLGVGLDPAWLRALPGRLGLDGVQVRIDSVDRASIRCWKVDFDIPPQPHGRHIHQIRAMVERADEIPTQVRDRANEAFLAIGMAEAEIHGTTIEQVHLHEVGAVDAILDVVGSIWGLRELGVERVYCGPIATGDGTVKSAHGLLPVPAPATLKLLEGHSIRPGPDNSGELVTPTGAALVRVLSAGPPPATWTPLRSGFGAGTKEFRDRANALRITLAEVADGRAREEVVQLAADIDDMSPEYLAASAEALRQAGALDVVTLPVTMKKGRAGTRLEVLARPEEADALEALLLRSSTTIGVRRARLERRTLPREERVVTVSGQEVRVKVVTLPTGARRAKPEFEDVLRASQATGEPWATIFREASDLAERSA